jgi:hypothetical protein
MHVDSILKHLALGFSLRDVVGDATLMLRTSLDLRALAEQPDLVLNNELHAKLDFKVGGMEGSCGVGVFSRGDGRDPCADLLGKLRVHERICRCAAGLADAHAYCACVGPQCNFCRGVMSTLVEELLASIDYVHKQRQAEEEYQDTAFRQVGRGARRSPQGAPFTPLLYVSE